MYANIFPAWITLFSVKMVISIPCDDLSFKKANYDFGFELLDRLERNVSVKTIEDINDSNILISPMSINLELSMLLPGAKNRTYQQIIDILGLNATYANYKQKLFSYIGAEYRKVLNRFQQSSEEYSQLIIANALAIQTDFILEQSFVQTLTNQFDADILLENFRNFTHHALEDINQWVLQITDLKLNKFFSNKTELTNTTEMVLINAVYFNGIWKRAFALKQNDTFTNADGTQVTVPFMVNTANVPLNYSEFDDGQLVQLSYANQTATMLLFLPNSSVSEHWPSLSSLFTSKPLALRMEALHPTIITLSMPRFTIDCSYSLENSLKSMGMTDAFNVERANFSGISEDIQDLQLSKVWHRTMFKVDEQGVESVAATGDEMLTSISNAEMAVNLNINRPFLYLIYDNQDEQILFAGILNKM